MRDHVETRVVVMFPFSLLGCDSESSVAVSNNEPKIINVAQDHHLLPITKSVDMKERRRKGGGRMASVRNFLTPKSSIFQGLVHRFIQSFSNLFMQEKEMELEEEEEMQIGFPTDVKHVTHIGMDGSTTMNPPTFKGFYNNSTNWETPPISVTQFQLALAAQAAAAATTGSATVPNTTT